MFTLKSSLIAATPYSSFQIPAPFSDYVHRQYLHSTASSQEDSIIPQSDNDVIVIGMNPHGTHLQMTCCLNAQMLATSRMHGSSSHVTPDVFSGIRGL